MFRNKRQGVELSINTIIIFALTILVLLVLAFIIMGGFSNWNKGTKCQNQGGECSDIGTSCPDKFPITSAYSCPDKQRCCIAAVGLN